MCQNCLHIERAGERGVVVVARCGPRVGNSVEGNVGFEDLTGGSISPASRQGEEIGTAGHGGIVRTVIEPQDGVGSIGDIESRGGSAAAKGYRAVSNCIPR